MKNLVVHLMCILIVLSLSACASIPLVYQSGDVPFQLQGGMITLAGLEGISNTVKLDAKIDTKKKEIHLYNTYRHGLFLRITYISLYPYKEFTSLDDVGPGKLGIKCDNDPGQYLEGKSFNMNGTYTLTKKGEVYTLTMTITEAYGVSLEAKMVAGKFSGKPITVSLSFTQKK